MKKYSALVVGRPGLAALLHYELVVLVAQARVGALGLALRKALYPGLLGSCGRNVVFGHNVVLRHPHKIHIGSNVVIDDHCLIDAKGDSNQGIRIGDGVFVGRNTILSCKNGDIELGDGANLGFNCEVFSASRVCIGANVLMAVYAYVIGGDHDFSDGPQPGADAGTKVGGRSDRRGSVAGRRRQDSRRRHHRRPCDRRRGSGRARRPRGTGSRRWRAGSCGQHSHWLIGGRSSFYVRRSARGACGHAEPRTWRSEARHQRQFALGVGPQRQCLSACGHAEPRTWRSEARHQRQFALGVGPQRQCLERLRPCRAEDM